MTDEELVTDAHAFAKELAAKVSDDKSMVLDGNDGAPWAVTVIAELARILAVSFVAATGNEAIFPLFMRHVAESAVAHAVDPRIVEEAIAEARKVAAHVDDGGETMQ